MLSEFSLRREIACVEAGEGTPLQKAKAILRIARRIKEGAMRLSVLSEMHFRSGDRLRGARLREATQRLFETHEYARTSAVAVLNKGSKALEFGYSPRREAYPRWTVNDRTPEVAI